MWGTGLRLKGLEPVLNFLMTQVRFTYEDLRLFPDDGLRRELIDGEVYVTPSPTSRHQRVVTNLAFRIGLYLHDNPLGEVFVAPLDVIFSVDDDVTEPDILYVSNERASIISERGIEGAPDWLIEVTSPSTRKRDFTLKLKRYQRYGVRLYWIVDLEAEMIHVWEEGGHEVFEADDTLSVSLLPGFSLAAGEILR